MAEESTGAGRRRPRTLSLETRGEIFLQITTGEITPAEAARKWTVDVSTIIDIRRAVKDAVLAAAAAKPGRPTKERDRAPEAPRAEIAQLTEAVKTRQVKSDATKDFMAAMAVAQHHGRPHTPTGQAWIETLFGHVKGEWPHLGRIGDPALLEHELTRVHTEYPPCACMPV